MTDISKLVGYDIKDDIISEKAEQARIRRDQQAVSFRGKELLLTEYVALTRIAEQLNRQTPEEIVSELAIQNKHVVHLNLAYNLVPNRNLQIPSEITYLTTFNCECNGIKELDIPSDLTNLKYINCSNNKLTRLDIPQTLTHMKSLHCNDNPLEQVDIPEALTHMKNVRCQRTPISDIVKQQWKDRGIEVHD